MLNIDKFSFKCPCCQGSQYRTSVFDSSIRNPAGAKCIFCKSDMVMFKRVEQQIRSIHTHQN
ncbi:cold-shock protein [Apirhabdus apintestini]|uniref:cold shock small protein YmcF n=1 Tax=Erwinia sp. HR93 TaxID=3094840 RepID=UPI002ADEB3BC|nr:cold-shock protein [Erwinia sp. HR93]MEA1062642.1 cold-shock protein [Erwinia sp. HR93]WPM84663.1 cold-shock protein [Enterobacteriaceae bacterium CA-0114]